MKKMGFEEEEEIPSWNGIETGREVLGPEKPCPSGIVEQGKRTPWTAGKDNNRVQRWKSNGFSSDYLCR